MSGFELRTNSTSLYPMPNNLLTEEKIVYTIYLKFNKVIRYLYVCLNLKIQIFKFLLKYLEQFCCGYLGQIHIFKYCNEAFQKNKKKHFFNYLYLKKRFFFICFCISTLGSMTPRKHRDKNFYASEPILSLLVVLKIRFTSPLKTKIALAFR